MAECEQQVLEDLQVRLAFVDEAVSGLSSADADLARRLDVLERRLEAMRDELLSLRAASGHDPESEPPPPHY